jgi:hypothetical protein
VCPAHEGGDELNLAHALIRDIRDKKFVGRIDRRTRRTIELGDRRKTAVADEIGWLTPYFVQNA